MPQRNIFWGFLSWKLQTGHLGVEHWTWDVREKGSQTKQKKKGGSFRLVPKVFNKALNLEWHISGIARLNRPRLRPTPVCGLWLNSTTSHGVYIYIPVKKRDRYPFLFSVLVWKYHPFPEIRTFGSKKKFTCFPDMKPPEARIFTFGGKHGPPCFVWFLQGLSRPGVQAQVFDIGLALPFQWHVSQSDMSLSLNPVTRGPVCMLAIRKLYSSLSREENCCVLFDGVEF